MKRLLFVLIISSILLTVTGCSQGNEVYDKLMKKGLEQIAEDKFVQAEGSFEMALEEKPEDEEASLLLKQTVYMIEGEQAFIDGDLEAATKSVKEVIKLDKGSEDLIKKAVAMEDQLETFKDNKQLYIESYQKAEQELADEAYETSLKTIEEVVAEDLSHAFYTEIKQDMESLQAEVVLEQEQVNTAIKKEAEEKAAAKVEAEKKVASNDIGSLAGYWLNSNDETLACHFTNNYVACAVAYSDVITNDKIKQVKHISSTETQITFVDGFAGNYDLVSNDVLIMSATGESYRRVSKEVANAIYDGYYELP